MKKVYMISRVVLAAMTLILFGIIIINEDSSWKFIPIIFSLIVFGLSFPSTIFAKKIIEIGNKIENIFLKILYYIILPIILLVICLFFYIVILHINDVFTTTLNELGAALSKTLLLLFIVAIVVIMVILPYIQAIIINVIKKIIK